jgi:cation:H+ antiporter
MLDAMLSLAERFAPLSFLLGVGLLLGGGHWLVEGSVAIARRLGMSTLLIGLTIVACGTSAPELFFNVAAALSGSGDLSFGNVVGSNIANIGLVIGVATFIAPLAVHRSVLRRDLPILIGSSVLMLALAWLPATRLEGGAAGFGRPDGIILLAGFVIVIATWIVGALRSGGRVPVELEEVADGPERALPGAIALFVVGLAALVTGGKAAEIGAVGIAEAAGLSPALIGLTIVAIATSLPEVVTAVIAIRRGHADLAMGNVVGSNLFNILFVFGATSFAGEVRVPAHGWTDLAVMLAMTIALLPIAVSNGRQVLRWQSGLLLATWAGVMIFSVLREVLGPAAEG